MRGVTTAVDVLGPGGALASVLGEGFEHREQQVRMAEAVARTLDHGGALLVEAGTGTGKSLAYLAAASLSGRRTVVSTGTRNLQDQLLRDDIPLLERALGRSLAAVCLKGLGNYLCRRKLDAVQRGGRLLDPVAEAVVERVARWAASTKTGDRSECPGVPEDHPVWADLCASAETRLGARCVHHEECFVTAARRAAKAARVVVVNHHLYFADLVTRGGPASILPDYDAVVFDEAHQIEGVATTFFGRVVGTSTLEGLLRDARRALAQDSALPAGTPAAVEPLLAAVAAGSVGLFGALRPPGEPLGRVELPHESLAGAPEAAWFRLDDALDALAARLAGLPTADEEVLGCARRAESLRHDLGEILSVDATRTGFVAWKDVGASATSVGASPIDVSERLANLVFSSVGAAVLTSATLAVDGSFAFVRERCGVDGDELILDSPFDYPAQAALYLPRHAPDPRHDDAVDRVAALVVETVGVVGGGALALFTSRKDMAAAAALLRRSFDGVVLAQGERSRRALLERLRAAGGRERVVLCATASFWEGVDVPGDALRVVAIARLPFASPADPLVAARSRHLAADGRNAFLEDHVPRACLALKQGFGRLIRTSRDRGVVAICDRRVRTMGYGRTFLRSLPACTVVENESELAAWWAGRAGANDQS